MGAALDRFGDAGVSLGVQVTKNINEGRVREVDNQASEKIREALYNPEKGYLTLIGSAAINGYKVTETNLRDIGATLASGLDNGAQRAMFAAVWQRRLDSALNSTTLHAAQQSKVYNQGQAEARTANSQADAVTNANDPEAYGLYKNTMMESAVYGLDGEQAKLAASKALTGMHTDIISNMIAQDSSSGAAKARAWYANHSAEIAPAAHDNILKALAAGGQQQDSLSLFFDLQAKHPGNAGKQLAELDALAKPSEAPNYGKRPDGSQKGSGWFGEIKRPDGTVMTEVTAGIEINGKEADVPLLVPTLSAGQVETLRNMPMDAKPPKDILDKAAAWASQRERAGKSPYADQAESPGSHAEISAEVYDATKQRLEHADARAKQAEGENNNNMLGAAQDYIINHPGMAVTDLPPSLYRWAKDNGQLANLDSFTKRSGKGLGDDALFTKLRFSAVNDPVAFAADFRAHAADYRGRLDDQQYNKALDIATSSESKDLAAQNIDKQIAATVRGVDADLRSSGIDTTPKEGSPGATQWQSYKAQLFHALDAETQAQGHSLKPDEARKIALGLLKKQEIEMPFWFNKKKMSFEMTDEERAKAGVTSYESIPKDDIARINGALFARKDLWPRFGIKPGSPVFTQPAWKSGIETLYKAQQAGVKF